MIFSRKKIVSAAILLVSAMVARPIFAQSVADTQTPLLAPASNMPVQAPLLNPDQIQQIVLSEVRGEVLIQKAGTSEWIPASAKMKLSVSDTIKTGEKGAVLLTFDGKARVELVSNTQITVEQAAHNGSARATTLQLDLGRLKADIDKLSGASTFEIKTPTAVASVRGTILFLNASGLGQAIENQTTDLFVDKGLVNFAPLENLNGGILVDKFGLSSIFGDGSILDLRHLSSQERQEFIDLFADAFNQAGNPQGEVEESGGSSDDSSGDSDSGEDPDFSDKISEQDSESQFAQDFLSTFDDLSDADQNRTLIELLLLKTTLQLVTAAESFEDQESDGSTAFLLSDGNLSAIHRSQDESSFQLRSFVFVSEEEPADDEWSFENVSGENADYGIVSDSRLSEQDRSDKDDALDESSDAYDEIFENVDEIDGLLDQANATDDNAQFVPPALTASDEVDDDLDTIEANAAAEADRLARIEALRDEERQEVRDVMNDIVGDQTFNLIQAQVEEQNDQMTGKVFTDMHGNRVRTDEYIFQPNDYTVEVLSLTLRTGDYQPGISSFLFGVEFNDSIPDEMTFRDLPWSDYLNVVTREEMARALQIEEMIWVDNGEYESFWDRNPDFDALAEQYVVHETNTLVDGYEFWPEHFYAEFRNPQGEREQADLIRFDEYYGNPTTEIGNGYELYGTQADSDDDSDDDQEYYVQPHSYDSTLIAPSGQDAILIERHASDHFFTLTIGEGQPQTFSDGEGDDSSDEPQANGFVGEFYNTEANPDGLMNEDGINYFRSHENNEDDDVDNEIHPAFFEDQYHDRGIEDEWLGRNTLIGIFVPIDNRGNVLDDNSDGNFGFNIRGIRDLVVPNTNINDGHYNLEVILAYGYVDGDDIFHEDFRIDTIITPELLTHHGFVNDSALFPPLLDEYEDDCGRNCFVD